MSTKTIGFAVAEEDEDGPLGAAKLQHGLIDGVGGVAGEVPAGHVAEVALAVAVVALGHCPDAGARPIGVGHQQQPLPENVTLDRRQGTTVERNPERSGGLERPLA